MRGSGKDSQSIPIKSDNGMDSQSIPIHESKWKGQSVYSYHER